MTGFSLILLVVCGRDCAVAANESVETELDGSSLACFSLVAGRTGGGGARPLPNGRRPPAARQRLALAGRRPRRSVLPSLFIRFFFSWPRTSREKPRRDPIRVELWAPTRSSFVLWPKRRPNIHRVRLCFLCWNWFNFHDQDLDQNQPKEHRFEEKLHWIVEKWREVLLGFTEFYRVFFWWPWNLSVSGLTKRLAIRRGRPSMAFDRRLP